MEAQIKYHSTDKILVPNCGMNIINRISIQTLEAKDSYTNKNTSVL